MKYIVVLCDGVADSPSEKLGGKTPLALAKKPNIDRMATRSLCGMVQTVPDSMKPGSDVANLSVMGYDPTLYYSGRSPLEALSMGIDMLDTDLAIRCNLVTLSDEEEYSDKTMLDYSAGEISTDEARELISAVQSALGDEKYTFYSGVSYRHCLIAHDSVTGTTYTPPHDILDKNIGEYLPQGLYGDKMLEMMRASWDILVNHPINKKRVSEGKRPANSIWLWGEGTKPMLPLFYDMHGKKGAVISAVDLLKGIGKASGMEIIDVAGATGTIDTNFDGKAKAAVDAIRRGIDYVYVHLEATDECGHQGDADGKVRAIELIDEKVIGYIMSELSDEELTVLVCPDHPTPLAVRTHTRDSVPFMIYCSGHEYKGVDSYTEESCSALALKLASGSELLSLLFSHDKYSTADSEVLPSARSIDANLSDDGADIIADADPAQNDEAESVTDGSIMDVDPTQSVDNESAYIETADGTYVTTDYEDVDVENSSERVSPISVSTEIDKKNPKKELTPQQKKKRLIIAAIATLTITVILLLSILVPVLVVNAPKQFISDAEDFNKPVGDKKQYYVLKKDITVNGDLSLTMSIDTNGKSLTVEGTLTISNHRNSDLMIGKRKSGEYIIGGSISAKHIVITDCHNAVINATLSAEELKITDTESITVNGNINVAKKLSVNGVSNGGATFNSMTFGDMAEIDITNSNAQFNYAVQATIHATASNIDVRAGMYSARLDSESEARVSGKVSNHDNSLGEIEGGKLIFLREGTEIASVKDADTVWYDRNSGVLLINVKNEQYITHLKTPINISVIQEGTQVYLYVPAFDDENGQNVTHLQLRIDGKDPIVVKKNDNSKYDITQLVSAVGSYDIEVILLALDNNGKQIEYIYPSDPISIRYNRIVKLDMPENGKCVQDENGDYILSFDGVSGATAYIIKIDSYSFIINNTTYNLTKSDDKSINEIMNTVGAHCITVTATNQNDKNVQNSEPAIIGFIKEGKAGAVTLTAHQDGDSLSLSWNKAENVARYDILINGKRYGSTPSLNITLAIGSDIKTGDKITIVAVGADGYENGDQSNEYIVL